MHVSTNVAKGMKTMETKEAEKDWKQGGLCKICEQSGKKSYLKVYQINFDEAITFCEDETCTYPLGLEDSSDLIVNRNFTEITNSPQRRHSTSLQKPLTGLRKTTTTPLIKTKQAASSGFKSTGKVLAPYVVGKTSNSTEYIKSQTGKGSSEVSSAGAPSPQQTESEISWYGLNKCGPSQLSSLLFPQWQNKDALCWLDVVMCLFVHSQHLQHLAAEHRNSVSKEDESVLLALVKAYNQACALVNSSKKETCGRKLTEKLCNGSSSYASYVRKSDEDEDSKKFVSEFKNLTVNDKSIKTGAGLSMSADFNDNLSVYMKDDYQRAFSILNDCRESLFQYLQPNLKCSKGRNDSPVFAIPLLARGNPTVENMMKMKYTFQFHCKKCGYRKNDDYENMLPTFPNTDVADFNMKAPAFSRPCFRCNSPNQQRTLVYDSIADVVMIHFVQGLQSSDVDDLQFDYNGKRYTVTGLIQYRNDPDHFVTWIRDNTGKLWLEYDDLKSPVSQFKPQTLCVPSSQIHIVMWEATPLPNPTDKNAPTQRSSDQTVAQGKSVGCVDLQNEINMETTKVPHGKEKDEERNKIGTLGYDNFESMDTNESEVGKGEGPPNGDTDGHYKVTKESHDAVKSTPLANKGIMMVAFTANGNLVHVPLVSSGNFTANLPHYGTPNGNHFSPGSNIQTLRTEVQDRTETRGIGIPSRADGPKYLTHLTVKSQISLLKSLRARKNSLVQDVEARNGRSAPHEVTKQPLAPRNSSSAKNSEERVRKFDTIRGKTVPYRRNSAYFSSFQGKKFASYKEHSEESWNRYQRDLERQLSCSPVSEISDFSAPCSPAVSCHSDSVLFQKRKSETSIFCEEPDPIPYTGKRRRSSQSEKEEKKSSDSLDDDFINEILSNGTTLAPPSVTGRSDGECDVLRNLYSALNMPMPESISLTPSATNGHPGADSENLPDVKGLANFIESDSLNTLDDFLAQL